MCSQHDRTEPSKFQRTVEYATIAVCIVAVMFVWLVELHDRLQAQIAAGPVTPQYHWEAGGWAAGPPADGQTATRPDGE